MINPLLITLTGNPELSGKKRKPIFSSKNRKRFKKIGKIAAWGLAPQIMAARAADKALKKRNASKKAAMARKREETAAAARTEAAREAAANPTPETEAAATTAKIKSAAATAAAITAEREEAAEAPEADAPAEETPGEETPAAETAETEAPETEAPAEETAGDYFGAAKPRPVSKPLSIVQVKPPTAGPLEWIKNNKTQAVILAAALATGIFYTLKKK